MLSLPHKVLGTVSRKQHVSQLRQWVEQTGDCLQPFHSSSHSGGPSIKASLYPLTKSGQTAKVSVGKSYLWVCFLLPFFTGRQCQKRAFSLRTRCFFACFFPKKAEYTRVKVRRSYFLRRWHSRRPVLERWKTWCNFCLPPRILSSFMDFITICLNMLFHMAWAFLLMLMLLVIIWALLY